MNSGIYAIDICGMTYIGSTKNFEYRLKNHIDGLKENNHHNIILQRAFNKYGIENLIFSIIEEIPYEKSVILEREQFHIDKTRERGRCANISDASFGDCLTNNPNRQMIIEKRSKTVRAKIELMSSEERKDIWGRPGDQNGMYGKTHSEETREKLRNTVYTEETRKKMSDSAIKKFENRMDLRQNLSKQASERTGNKNGFFGKTHSDETKKSISEKNSGKIPSNSIQIEVLGKIYYSYHEASKELGLPMTTIRWRCMSKNKRFTDYKIQD